MIFLDPHMFLNPLLRSYLTPKLENSWKTRQYCRIDNPANSNWQPYQAKKNGINGFSYIAKPLLTLFFSEILSKLKPMKKNLLSEKVQILVKMPKNRILKYKFGRYFPGEPLEIWEKNVPLFSSLFNFTISYHFALFVKMAIFRKKLKKRSRGTRPRTSFGTNFGQIGLKYWSDPKM